MVVFNQLIFKNPCFVFDLELDMGTIKVQAVQIEVGVDQSWVTVQTLRSLRHELFPEQELEFLIIVNDLPSASSRLC